MNLNRKDSVFVNVAPPEPVQQQMAAEQKNRVWSRVAEAIAKDSDSNSLIADSNSQIANSEQPSIDDLFAEVMPKVIVTSRWGRYIAPGPASYVRDTVFVYHAPCDNFWSLYNLSKGIFRDLGIRLSKEKGFWLAHIPIRALTDKVFVESGLAAVEKTLLKHTGISPAVMLAEQIRQRQAKEASESYARYQRNFKGGRSHA